MTRDLKSDAFRLVDAMLTGFLRRWATVQRGKPDTDRYAYYLASELNAWWDRVAQTPKEALEAAASGAIDDAIRSKRDRFFERLDDGSTLDDVLEAFRLVLDRETLVRPPLVRDRAAWLDAVIHSPKPPARTREDDWLVACCPKFSVTMDALDMARHSTLLLDYSPLAQFRSFKRMTVGFAPLLVDLSSLAKVRTLEELEILHSPVRDLRPLLELPTLKKLFVTLDHCDLAPLAGSKTLEVLSASSSNRIDNAEAIASIETLRALELRGLEGPVAWLAKMTHLRSLAITSSHIQDLRVIGKLTGLTELTIEAPIKDLGFIKQLKALEHLNLCGCTAARDIAPLASLKELKSLFLRGVPIDNVKPIVSLRQLRTLDVSKTNVTDLSRLADLPHLERLRALRAGLASFGSLSRLTKLKQLSASAQTDGDLRPLASLVHLDYLDLTGPNVTDLGPLTRMQNLKELNLNDTGVTDLSPLAACTSLESLDLDDTLTETVEPLSDLPRLSTIDVSHCPRLVSIAPLARCPRLETVRARGCKALRGPTTIEELGGAADFDLRNHLPRTPPPGWTLPECDADARVATIEASEGPAPELAVKIVATLMPDEDQDTLLVYLLRRDEERVGDAQARQLLAHFRACGDFTERHDDPARRSRMARGFAARAERARRVTWGKYDVYEPALSVPACPDPGPPRPDAVFDLRHHLPDPVPSDWEATPTEGEDGVRFHTQECMVVVVLSTRGDIYTLAIGLFSDTGVRLSDEVARGVLGRFRAHAGLEETHFGPSNEAPGVRMFKGLARPM